MSAEHTAPSALGAGWPRWALVVTVVCGLVVWGCAGDQDGTPGLAPTTTPGAGGDGGAVGGAAPSAGGGGVGGSAAVGAGGSGGEPWVPVETDWCTDGWVGLNETTCFYAPAELDAEAGLFVFLHGMLPPDGSPKTMQSMVRDTAAAQGFVALFPRGRAGLCAWDPSVEDWWCWPTGRTTVDAYAAEIVAEWEAAAAVLEVVVGVSLTSRYVFGFSNGGYFASYVGLEQWWPTAGVGVVAAGRGYVDESLFGVLRPPFYIAVGDLDLPEVKQSAENLAWVLHLNDWPRQYVVHPNRGHELGMDDLHDAWSFWH